MDVFEPSEWLWEFLIDLRILIDFIRLVLIIYDRNLAGSDIFFPLNQIWFYKQ